MKPYISNFILFFIIILFTACEGEETIRFLNPQPSSVKDLKQFSKKITGEYEFNTKKGFLISFDKMSYGLNNDSLLDFSGDNYLEIDSKRIINYISGSYDLGQPSDSLEYILKDSENIDSLIMFLFRTTKLGYQIDTLDKNNLVLKFSLTDTLFDISLEDQYKLRKYKKKYYLNLYNDSTKTWTVFQLFVNEINFLKIHSISQNDITILDRLLEVNFEKKDSTYYDPSLKVFKEFIKLGGFANKVSLKRRN